jgi:hypothetical protein
MVLRAALVVYQLVRSLLRNPTVDDIGGVNDPPASMSRPSPLDFMNHPITIGEPELIVPPVPVSTLPFDFDQGVRIDVRILQFDVPIVISPQQSKCRESPLVSFLCGCFANGSGLQPSVMRALMVLGVEVPIGGSKFVRPRRKSTRVLRQIRSISRKGSYHVYIAMFAEDKGHVT